MNWDLKSYFAEFNGPAMSSFKIQLEKDTAMLLKRASGVETLNQENAADWEAVFLLDEELGARSRMQRMPISKPFQNALPFPPRSSAWNTCAKERSSRCHRSRKRLPLTSV